MRFRVFMHTNAMTGAEYGTGKTWLYDGRNCVITRYPRERIRLTCFWFCRPDLMWKLTASTENCWMAFLQRITATCRNTEQSGRWGMS